MSTDAISGSRISRIRRVIAMVNIPSLKVTSVSRSKLGGTKKDLRV
jgi:NAD(P)H-nitrite reductase large subunit